MEIRSLTDDDVQVLRSAMARARDAAVSDGRRARAAWFHALAVDLDDELDRRAAEVKRLGALVNEAFYPPAVVGEVELLGPSSPEDDYPPSERT